MTIKSGLAPAASGGLPVAIDPRPLPRAPRRSVWLAGVRTGAQALLREPILGAKRLLLPVSYWRYQEFRYVARQLDPVPGARVLDLGSPKDLAVHLARDYRCTVVATDILPAAVQLSDRYAAACGRRGDGPGRVRSEVQDGRALAYADGSFDGAFSVSVIEHIPDGGDRRAVSELLRVTRPGGIVVVTVPFADRYRETWVERDVYERARGGAERVFYERHYDEPALHRLLDGLPAELIGLEYWGEPRWGVERWLSRIGRVRTLLSPLEGALSRACLRPIAPGRPSEALAAFLTLRKAA